MVKPEVKKGWFDLSMDWGKLGRVAASVIFCLWIGATGWIGMRDNLAENSAAVRQLSSKLDASLASQNDHVSALRAEITTRLQAESDKNLRERQILEARIMAAENRVDSGERHSREDAATLMTLREQSANTLATLTYLRDLLQSQSGSKSNR